MKKWWAKQIPKYTCIELLMFAAISIFVFVVGLILIVRYNSPDQGQETEFIYKRFPVTNEVPASGRNRSGRNR